MLKRIVFLFMAGFIFVFFSAAVEARADFNFDVSIGAAPPPPPNVVMVPPQGYNNCYVVPGSWVGNMWIPTHQECAYPGTADASVWVSGYWGCVVVGPGGSCGRWKWFSHHMARGHQVRYEYGDAHSFHHHRHW